MVIQPRFRGNDEGFYTMLWRYLHVDGTHRSPWRYTQIRPWTGPSCSTSPITSPLKGDIPNKFHYIRCIWGWLLEGPPPKGTTIFPWGKQDIDVGTLQPLKGSKLTWKYQNCTVVDMWPIEQGQTMVCLDFFCFLYIYTYICLFFARCLLRFFLQTSHDLFSNPWDVAVDSQAEHQGIPVWEHRFWKHILGPRGSLIWGHLPTTYR